MASRTGMFLAQKLPTEVLTRKNTSQAHRFYQEICRCLPFIHRIHNMDEVLSLRDLRAIVKEQFAQYKDVKDPRVVNMLVFKGREELETYLMRHKQRHHAITEYVEPYIKKRDNIRKLSGTSSFLDTFFETGYPQIPRKWT